MAVIQDSQPKGAELMTLKTVKMRLPEELLSLFGKSAADVERHVAEALVLKLIGESKITASYAAEVLGCPYNDILELMAEHHIPLVRYSPADLKKEMAALEKLTS